MDHDFCRGPCEVVRSDEVSPPVVDSRARPARSAVVPSALNGARGGVRPAPSQSWSLARPPRVARARRGCRIVVALRGDAAVCNAGDPRESIVPGSRGSR